MSVKPLTTFRSAIAALALAFAALAGLSLPAAAVPDSSPGHARMAVVAHPQFVAFHSITELPKRAVLPAAPVTTRHSIDAPPKPVVLAPPTAPLPQSAQHFFAAVRASFAAWDRNHDGVLTREEIELDMQDPRIVGDAAAALAALKLGSTKYNHLDETRSFTLADIDAMERKLTAGRALAPDFLVFYVAGLKKLKEQPRELFVNGVPRISNIRQDFTTDCYFLSAAGAIASVNPRALVRLIARNDDGTFTVTFPGQRPLRVPAPTDSEIAVYTISKDGIWLNVLERAFAMLRIEFAPNLPVTREPLDSVGFLFGSTGVIELLTGHASRVIAFPARTHEPIDDGLIAKTRTEVESALRERRGVTVSSEQHAYAIVAYDAARDLITVHNPYNRAGAEAWIKGERVERNAEGFFVIPTSRLVGNFHYVRVEVSPPVGS